MRTTRVTERVAKNGTEQVARGKQEEKAMFVECAFTKRTNYDDGTYNMILGDEKFEDEGSLEDYVRENSGPEIYQLGRDILPEGMEDITNRVHSIPGVEIRTVLGWMDDQNSPHYVGIAKLLNQ